MTLLQPVLILGISLMVLPPIQQLKVLLLRFIGNANGHSADTVGVVTAINGNDLSVSLSDRAVNDIKKGAEAHATVNNKGLTFK